MQLKDNKFKLTQIDRLKNLKNLSSVLGMMMKTHNPVEI